MAKKSSLASMSVDGLLKMRDEIADVLSRKASQLQNQLALLTGTKKRGRPSGKLKGRKVAPKYKGPNGELWAGRGMKPKWLVAEMKKGKKLESFAIK